MVAVRMALHFYLQSLAVSALMFGASRRDTASEYGRMWVRDSWKLFQKS